MAIISHIGRNTDHGHYVCHIKKDNHWAFFNDEKVAPSPAISYSSLNRVIIVCLSDCFTVWEVVESDMNFRTLDQTWNQQNFWNQFRQMKSITDIYCWFHDWSTVQMFNFWIHNLSISLHHLCLQPSPSTSSSSSVNTPLLSIYLLFICSLFTSHRLLSVIAAILFGCITPACTARMNVWHQFVPFMILCPLLFVSIFAEFIIIF